MNEQSSLFEMPEPIEPAPHADTCVCNECILKLKREMHNPCISLFGPGPEGVTCETCIHLQRFHQAAYWQKCALRQASKNVHVHGDHRIRWPSCAKYQPAPVEEAQDIPRKPKEPINLVVERIRRSLESHS